MFYLRLDLQQPQAQPSTFKPSHASIRVRVVVQEQKLYLRTPIRRRRIIISCHGGELLTPQVTEPPVNF